MKENEEIENDKRMNERVKEMKIEDEKGERW